MNPYEKPTAEEIAREEALEKEMQDRFNATIELGKKCMQREEFQKYKEEYEKAREIAIDFLMEHVNEDPIKFAFQCIAVLNKIQTMKQLINLVELDAKRIHAL